MRVPILAGPLRGTWWTLTSPGKLGRVLTGSYEPAHAAAFAKLVTPGATVLDLGAHTGYHSLLFSRLVGERGSVWAFEPDPRNFSYLQRHVRINRVRNVHPQPLAIAESAGSSGFAHGSGSGTGHLADRADVRVETTTVDAFCAARALRPDFLKVDVEGAELRVLQGARSVLDAARPTIVLSTHSAALNRDCTELLIDAGYSVSSLSGRPAAESDELIARPA